MASNRPWCSRYGPVRPLSNWRRRQASKVLLLSDWPRPSGTRRIRSLGRCEDDAATFDVQPTAPGGPALRSHLPLVARDDGRRSVVGVLAVAHQHRLDPDSRRVLERLADTAAALLGRPAQRESDESG